MLRPKATALRVASRLLAAGLVLFLAARLWHLWHRQPIDFGKLDVGVFAAAVVSSAAAVTAYGLVWPYVLRRLGVEASASWIGLYFKSQLGKYVPGSVWQYAGRVALSRSRGVPVQTALVSVVVEVVASAGAAAIAAVLVLPLELAFEVWAGLGVLCGIALALRRWIVAGVQRFSSLGRRLPRVDRAAVAAGLAFVPAALALYLLVWGIYGAAFWLTARALFATPVSELPLYIGTFAAAWVVGLVVVFAPGGIGVREAVIVALLSSRLGEAHAIALAVTSRVILSAVDLVAGTSALALPLLRRSRRRSVSAAE